VKYKREASPAEEKILNILYIFSDILLLFDNYPLGSPISLIIRFTKLHFKKESPSGLRDRIIINAVMLSRLGAVFLSSKKSMCIFS